MYRLHQYTIFIIIIQILEFIYNLENGKITGMIIPSIVSFWRGKEKSSMAELGLTNSGNWSCVFDQSWRGEENCANSNRIQTWPISHFTGESWLVTSRARFEASYFGIEPGNVVKPLSRPTIPQLSVLFTFSDLIQPSRSSNNFYTFFPFREYTTKLWYLTNEINKYTGSRFIYLFSSLKFARQNLRLYTDDINEKFRR